MQEGKTHADIARAGAKAANAKRTPEEKKRIAKKGARAAWKGHVKKDPSCACTMCKKRRAKAKAK